MFKGTLRFNLDIDNKYSDERIKELLFKAGLEEFITKDE
jgi:ABC-type transport system involved in cytochrome bd biosynthesis fused ATPase/permease subunit